MRALRFLCLLAVAMLAVVCIVEARGDGPWTTDNESPDVVVYGGTPAGVAAAVAAARHGSAVTLVAEGATIGGMMSNGLSASDVGSSLTVQGLAADYFSRVRDHYRDPQAWRFEPHVAERILRDMLEEAGVDVLYHRPIAGTTVAKRRIRCLAVTEGRRYCADTFIDATYTGDLLAAAGVPHKLGMADLYAYGESLPELRRWKPVLPLDSAEDPAARAAFGANPFIRTADVLKPYRESFAVGTPSLTYRLCVTSDAKASKRFTPAPGYSTLKPSFELMMRAVSDEVLVKSNGSILSDVYQIATLPDGKYDLNSGGLSFTNIPAPEGYFNDMATRRRVNATLRDYVQSFFYFVQNDPSVPRPVQEHFRPFGLCLGEFEDNGNWPREPYVREGRRIEGRYTFTQKDIFSAREKSTSVALGSYDVDGKLSQILYTAGGLYRDAGIHSRAPIYEIPYQVMVPRAGSVLNVLAPIGLSASPTAYGSLRMEPQYMALGEAAGIAASISAESGRAVHAVPAADIQSELADYGVVHKAKDICRVTPARWRQAGGFSRTCAVLSVEPHRVL